MTSEEQDVLVGRLMREYSDARIEHVLAIEALHQACGSLRLAADRVAMEIHKGEGDMGNWAIPCGSTVERLVSAARDAAARFRDLKQRKLDLGL